MSREASPDASQREDEDVEAVERRRRARQEILERGRIMEERRRSKLGSKGMAKSFDDIVDETGALKPDQDIAAMTTSAEPRAEDIGLRYRNTEAKAAALGSVVANPFADEMHIDAEPTVEDPPEAMISRSSTPTLSVSLISPPVPPKPAALANELHTAASPLVEDPPDELISRSSTPKLNLSPVSPPIPSKPAAYDPQRLLIDTEELSNHPSEQLLDLTPTTSASSAVADLAELNENRQASSYWSVQEWARNSAPPDFYSPPQSEAAGSQQQRENSTEGSRTGTGEHASQMGSENLDVVSDDERGISTPGSWTEVGSQVSEDY